MRNSHPPSHEKEKRRKGEKEEDGNTATFLLCPFSPLLLCFCGVVSLIPHT
jgi:hypothetical protein